MYNHIYTNEDISNILRIKAQSVVPNLVYSVYNFSGLIDNHDYSSGIRIIDTVSNLDSYLIPLRDYQTVGVGFMYYAYRSILGDDTGLGKTVMACSLINTLRKYNKLSKFLFIGDNNSVAQVLTEFRKFTGLNVVELKGDSVQNKRLLKKYKMENSIEHIDGIILPHSAIASNSISEFLAQHIDNNGKSVFNVLFLDESSVIKNKNTNRFKWLSDFVDRVERVHFLNATAVENTILDIYNQLSLLDKKALPSKTTLETHFCIKQKKQIYVKGRRRSIHEIKGYRNEDIFRNNINLYYFGRSREKAGIQSKHSYKVYSVQKTPLQEHLLKRRIARPNIILNNPEGLESIGLSFTRDNVPKLDKLVQLLDKEYRGKKVFIYTFNKLAQNVILKELTSLGFKVGLLNGEVVDEERQSIIDGFNGSQYDVLVSNILRAVNLYKGDVCIYYQYFLNPASMEQVKGRIDRNEDINNISHKEYVLLYYDDSIELSNILEQGHLRGKCSVDLTKEYDNILLNFYNIIKERS